VVRCGSASAGYRNLCTPCFNAVVAELWGLDRLDNAQFEPVTLVDKEGCSHTFHFQYRYVPNGVTLEAFELDNEGPRGYRFGVIGQPENDPFKLLADLIAKIRQGLAIRHLVESRMGLQIADHGIVRGHIDCDPDGPERVPLLVIDGQEITWDDFGSMLVAYEGWRFKLVIRDLDENDSG
jgi:hypothetical protein